MEFFKSLRGDGTPSPTRVLILLLSTVSLLAVVAVGSAAVLSALDYLSLGLTTVLNAPMFVAGIRGWHVPHTILCGYFAAMTVCLVLYDLRARSIGIDEVWPIFTVFIWLPMLLKVHMRFSSVQVWVICMWLVVTTFESVYRFGLFDLPGTADVDFRRERLAAFCSCSVPPCKLSLKIASRHLGVSGLVIVLVFICMRRFARREEAEQASMSRTIQAVETIADLLSQYDVDTVAEMLQEAKGQLPEAMHDALQRLEQNLRLYRPYLPKSCLPHNEDNLDVSSLEEVQKEDVSDGTGSTSVKSLSRSTFLVVPGTAAKGRTLNHLVPVRASALVVNICRTIKRLADDPCDFATLFELVLDTTLSAVEGRKGVVDVFVGDRVLVSFNTSRPCVMHATSAAHAASRIANTFLPTTNTGMGTDAMDVNIGIATGKVLCGDVGCAEMRRFSLLGVLPLVACGMERAGRALHISVLCSVGVQREVEHEHTLLLVPRWVQIMKSTACNDKTCDNADPEGEPLQAVYELLTTDTVQPSGLEWIYEIGSGTNRWAAYNAAVHSYLRGDSSLEALGRAAHAHQRTMDTLQAVSQEPVCVSL